LIIKKRGDFHLSLAPAAREMLPWVKKGDDRVLSKMRIIAGSAVERIVKSEVGIISKSGQLPKDEKLTAMEALESQVKALGWLAEGFKSSIMVDMAFAKADVKSQM